jgi:hypothetical protein
MCFSSQKVVAKGSDVQMQAASVRPSLSSTALREQRALEDYAFRKGFACLAAVQLMTDVAVLSHEHDSSSLLQMPPEGVPGLADVVHVMLHAYALLDLFLLVRCFPRFHHGTSACCQ